MSELIQRRAAAFAAAARGALAEGKSSIFFCGRNTPIQKVWDDLEHLGLCTAAGVEFNILGPSDGQAFALAATGALGGDLVEPGQRMSKAYNGVKAVWGDRTDKVWSLKLAGITKNAKIAQAVCSCLDAGVKEAQLGDPSSARAAGAKFEFLTRAQWGAVKVILLALASANN